MRKIIFLLVCLFLDFPTSVLAHSFGQPPFFKINGAYAQLYIVPTSSLNDFSLPQDGAPENYLVNQEINFELDRNFLPTSAETINKTTFSWDFGDGGTTQGIEAKHTYSKIGSYLIKITADDKTTPTPQLIESALVNILPNKDYKLPQPVIKINGQQSKDPLTDILTINYLKPVELDATASVVGSAPIVSYFWDLGDQTSSSESKITHSYGNDKGQLFPNLRVKDSNGFIADIFVEIQNQNLVEGSALNIQNQNQPNANTNLAKKTDTPSQLKYVIIGVILLIMILTIGRVYYRKKISQKGV